jgi:Ser/Thr protein kinase RdoA (MazF antagonist)
MQRSLMGAEVQHLNNMRRYAALHFWLTRLRDQHLVISKASVVVKDPRELESMLKMLRAEVETTAQ